MASYTEWNDAIYNKYFRDKELSSDFLFFVNEESIKEIGKQIDANMQEPIKDFCRHIVVNDNIDLGGVSYYKPSRNTARIAFFILVASCMGDKEIASLKTGYWATCQHLLNLSNKPELYVHRNKKSYFDMFNYFSEFIRNEYKIDFNFKSLFNRAENQKDYIGLPISQAMISTMDRYLLTQVFDKYQNKIISDIFNYVQYNLQKHSKIFKKLCNEEEYIPKIKQEIQKIWEHWDGVVIELDRRTNSAKVVLLPFLFGFYVETKNGENAYKFGITTRIKDNLSDITFSNFSNNNYKNYTLSKNTASEKYYRLNTEFYTLEVFKDYNFKTDNNIKLCNKLLHNKFIFFKKDEKTENWIQTERIYQGDRFSILGKKSFFYDDYDYFADYVTELKAYEETIFEDCFMAYDLFAEVYDGEYIKLAIKDKLEFKKGLKINNNTYVAGAGPIIKIQDLDNIAILNSSKKQIFGEELYQETKICRCKDYPTDKYRLNCNNTEIGRSFEITAIQNVCSKQTEEKIYQTIEHNKIKLLVDNNADKYICGALICGYELPDTEEFYKQGTELYFAGKYDEALENFNKYIKNNMNKNNLLVAEAYFYIGIIYNKKRNYKNSIKHYTLAIEYNKKNPEYYDLRAEVYYKQEDFEKAVKDWDKVLKLGTDYDIDYFHLAYAEDEIGDLYNAKEHYEKYLESYPDNEIAKNNIARVNEKIQEQKNEKDRKRLNTWNNRASKYYTEENYRLAVKNWNKVLEEAPDYDIDYFDLAYAEDEIGELDNAKEHYEKYLESYPDSYSVYNNLGWIYEQQGNLKNAKDYYKNALNKDSTDEIVKKNLARVNEKIQEQEKDRKRLNTWNDRASKYYTEKNYRLAVKNWNKVLNEDPNYDIDYFHLAYAENEIGKDEDAKEHYTIFIKNNPNSEYLPHAHNNRGNIFKKQDDYKNAIKDFDKAIKIDSHEPLYFDNRADAYYWWAEDIYVKDYKTSQKYYKNAVNDWGKVLELDRNYNIDYFDLAWAENEIGEYKNAKEHYTIFIKNNSASKYLPDAYNYRGLVYEKLGQLDMAKEDYEKALAIQPDYETAVDNLKCINDKIKQI